MKLKHQRGIRGIDGIRREKPQRDWLDIAGDLAAWGIATITVTFGLMCLTKGRDGINHGTAFIGLGLSVCPAIRIHIGLRVIILVICAALLS